VKGAVPGGGDVFTGFASPLTPDPSPPEYRGRGESRGALFLAMPQILFVTGKLAEPSLRRVAGDLAASEGFSYDVAVLPITVAALAPTTWIANHLPAPENVERAIIPGMCSGDLDVLTAAWPGVAVERGPADLRDLPEYFGKKQGPSDYGRYDIEILAEINFAPRLTRAELFAMATRYRADGADVIDLGCEPGSAWSGLADAVRCLRDEGMRVSIDTFDPAEAAAGAKAGAELVLSVNQANRAAAVDWGCEVVVVPDVIDTLEGLDATVDFLTGRGVRFRVDPVLSPIGFGFAASLVRYAEVRKRYPDAEILMGVGNLTELTDVDSAGVNVVLLGYCQELGIRSVLTTEVINWCRSSIRELDLARRLVAYACDHRVLPKRLEPNLVILRDPKLREHGARGLEELGKNITDHNFRLFAERGLIHVLARDLYLKGDDPFALFAEMAKHGDIDAPHAFYLGYEMAKAITALTLGKNYTQDQALRWGFATRDERPRRHDDPV
jgi:dihydropteroate synthase